MKWETKSKNRKFIKSLGADATFNYKLPLEKQLEEIDVLTEGKCARVFDASAMATETGMSVLEKYKFPYEGSKYFSTTNDWCVLSSYFRQKRGGK